jgi:adenylosuccinate synthase
MAVTVVIGGQFGSEGKGKVAHLLAAQEKAAVAVRVGGPNSGHTVIDDAGRQFVLRQLPSAAVLPGMHCVLGPGSYIDPDLLMSEMALVGLPPERLKIDENAVIVTSAARKAERSAGLWRSIGSTQSGTGAAVTMRVARDGRVALARNVPRLSPLVADTASFLRHHTSSGHRVIIEGTQGFGLSLLHAKDYPYVTSRDTTAAGFASEAGISPLDVDRVVMVIRAFPIRVAGNSGPLPREITWEAVAVEGGHDHDIEEFTSVTKRLRRVAQFDAEVVRKAIVVNAPSMIVLNHVDYVDHSCCKSGRPTSRTNQFVTLVEQRIGQQIDYLGFGPAAVVARQSRRRVSVVGA